MSQPLVPQNNKRVAPSYAQTQNNIIERSRRQAIRIKAEALGLIITDTGRVTTDVACPNDAQMVDVSCWKCGWQRDPTERTDTITKAKEAGLVPAWTR